MPSEIPPPVVVRIDSLPAGCVVEVMHPDGRTSTGRRYQVAGDDLYGTSRRLIGDVVCCDPRLSGLRVRVHPSTMVVVVYRPPAGAPRQEAVA